MGLNPTVTDVARNFAEYINRVAFRRERFILMRSGQPVAELGPVPTGGRLEDLPSILESLPRLGAADVDALERDLEAGRELLREAEDRDPWVS